MNIKGVPVRVKNLATVNFYNISDFAKNYKITTRNITKISYQDSKLSSESIRIIKPVEK